MKDDILKFRKTCEVLLNEKGYTKGSICKEAGMSEPTLLKLLNDELDSFLRDGFRSGMRSSTLGIIQDFNKRHRDDLSYAGIESITTDSDGRWISSGQGLSEVSKDEIKALREKLSNYKPDKPEEISNVCGLNCEYGNKFGCLSCDEFKWSGVLSISEQKIEPEPISEEVKQIKEISKALEVLNHTLVKVSENYDKLINQEPSSNLSDIEDLKNKGKGNIEPSNLVKIVISLGMKATNYRELADDFDKVANDLLSDQHKRE